MACEVWDLEAIQQRQDRLGELADEVWAIPSTVGGRRETAPDAMEVFRSSLGSLWASVEPLCHEVPPSLVEAWSIDLPQHLQGHQAHEHAVGELSDRLVALTRDWAAYDLHQRAVLAGAVGYFLALDDETHDESAEGLVDDAVVVAAAEKALTIRQSPTSA